MAHDMRAVVAFAPNGSAESAIMAAFMRSVSCPDDPSKKLHYSDSFYELFRQPLATPECADQLQCLSNPQCSSHLGEEPQPPCSCLCYLWKTTHGETFDEETLIRP